MKKNLSQLGKTLITACRILSQQGLVHGFGHVSARVPDSASFLITPRVSLALVGEKDLLLLNLNGGTVKGKTAAPFEASLHAAIYKARSNVNAVARFHARKANYFSVTEKRIDAVHNHGSFFQGGVPVFSKTDEAVVMAIYLEEAADMLHGALQIGSPIFLSPEESTSRKTETLPPVDLERAWNYFKSRVGRLQG
ncbi:MAG: class II aldolase/adducin family protein [Deltaproteobacteria bacterium]|nr:class II aldolase/adducin family protein [Deltaproteobacteria bacterium]